MKLAVIFPGMGYHVDKPLLYYAKKLAAEFGYEIADVRYGNLIGKGNDPEREKQEAFCSAMSQTEEILKDVDFARYDGLLFISKSIGTAVASAFAQKHGLRPYHIYFTPVKETFRFAEGTGVVFHGTGDPWIETKTVKKECQDKGLQLFITESANHSLETGDVLQDLKNLECVMEEVRGCLKNLEAAIPDRNAENMHEAAEACESYLIKDTTREQRERIVRESLGCSDIGCDDGDDGYDMYLPYIEGEKELKEITMEYRVRYLKNMETEERGGCRMW